MNVRRFYGFVLLVASGGMVFQTTTDCTGQLIESVAPVIVSALTEAILAAMLGGTAV